MLCARLHTIFFAGRTCHFVSSSVRSTRRTVVVTPVVHVPVPTGHGCQLGMVGMQVAPSLIPTSSTFFCGNLGHENISTAILPLPLIQEEQLSATGESTGSLPRNSRVWVTDHARNDLKRVEGP